MGDFFLISQPPFAEGSADLTEFPKQTRHSEDLIMETVFIVK